MIGGGLAATRRATRLDRDRRPHARISWGRRRGFGRGAGARGARGPHDGRDRGRALDDAGAEIGLATMSFAVLPRRDDNPDITTTHDYGPVDDGAPRLRAAGSPARRARGARGRRRCAASSKRPSATGAATRSARCRAARSRRSSTPRPRRPPRCDRRRTTRSSSSTSSSRISRSHASARSARATDVLARRPGAVTVHVELVDAGSRVSGSRASRGWSQPPRCEECRDDPRRAARRPRLRRSRDRPRRVALRRASRCARSRSPPSGRRRVVGHAPASDHLRGPSGGVRGGALLTMLDNVGGSVRRT